MESKLFVGVISVFVAIVVLAGALVPVINEAASGETTIHITNEDSSTLKLQKITSNFALDLSVTIDGDSNLIVSNGNDSIVADPNESMYILATDSAAIYYDQGDMVFIWTDENGTSERLLTNPFTAVIADGKLTVDDGTSTDAPLPSTFMFAPSSTGQYGSFAAADLNLVPNDPVIAAGSFAGVYCYNQNTTLGNDLQEYVTVSDDVLTEVIWAAATDPADQLTIQPFDPSQINFDPIDFNPIDPNENIIMTVPTPTYTEGDWGYDLASGKAVIVSYSGVGGDNITIPSTIGGYTVSKVGKGSNGNPVFDENISINNIIVSEGIERIESYAFSGCTGLTGKLVLPNSLISVNSYAFTGCTGFTELVMPSAQSIDTQAFKGCTGFTGPLVLPENLKWTSSQSFANCTGFTGPLVLPSSMTSVTGSYSGCTGIDSLVVKANVTPASNAFSSTSIREVLNLSSIEYTTTSYGLYANEVRSDIVAQLFVAPADVAITEGSPSAFAPLLNAIPMIIIMAILMMIVGYTMIRRSY